MLSPVWRAAADREMHMMHFHYRLGEKRGREGVVDKTKAWWVERVYCFFNCRACHRTLILDLCSICRRVSYICRLSRCYCSSPAEKSDAWFLQWKVKYFEAKRVCRWCVIFPEILVYQCEELGNIIQGSILHLSPLKNCSTLAYFCSKFFTRFRAGCSPTGHVSLSCTQ